METVNKIKTKLKANKKAAIISAAAFLLVATVTFGFIGGGSEATLITVKRGMVEEEVLATGKTHAQSEVDLGFERGGKVATISARVGSRVSTGQRLVTLEQADVLADLGKARASLNQALIELASARQTSPSSFDSVYQTHAANIRDAFVKADDAVRNGVDSFFTNPRSFNANFDPVIKDGNSIYYSGISQSIRSEISYERVAIEKLLNDWKIAQASLGKGEDLGAAFSLARNNLSTIGSFLDKIASAINSIESVQFAYNTTVQGYKDNVSTARGKINTALSNILTSKEKVDTAPAKIGSSYDDILIEEAKVESLRADVSSQEAELAKTVIFSPIAGVVTKLEAERGEIVSASEAVISVISDKNLQVEADVSEVNIGKVAVGNEVEMTFDAFAGETHKGKVFYIDPGETIIDGVPTYKVSVAFSDPVTVKIKSGLTANLNIITQKKEDVVKIPLYAVEREDGGAFVTIRDVEGVEKRREVTLGLSGSDGSIEIVSGLVEGEEIVVNL